jgi:hypothetical protein
MVFMVHLSHLYLLTFGKQVLATFTFCFDGKYQQATTGVKCYLLTHTSTITMTTSKKRTAETPPAIVPASSEDVSASVRHSVVK